MTADFKSFEAIYALSSVRGNLKTPYVFLPKSLDFVAHAETFIRRDDARNREIMQAIRGGRWIASDELWSLDSLYGKHFAVA